MNGGEESSFIRWRSMNDEEDAGAYFELNLGLHHNINKNEEMELVEVPFPGFQAAITAKSSHHHHHHQNQQLHVVEINSRWGPWGLVHTTRKSSSSSSSSVVMNGRRSWTVKVINISAASLERWFANFMVAFRLRSWKEKMMKIKILHSSTRNGNGNGNSIIITTSRPAAAAAVNLGHQNSLLHAAIAHCNNSCFPPLTLTN